MEFHLLLNKQDMWIILPFVVYMCVLLRMRSKGRLHFNAYQIISDTFELNDDIMLLYTQTHTHTSARKLTRI